MLDIRFVRENPDAVKENIRKKFQDAKLPLVDEVIALDAEYRAAIGEASDLRANRNKLSKQIGALMGQAKKDPSKAAEAEEIKKQVTAQADRLKELEAKETELQAKIQEIMYTIPQMIDPSVPIGPDDSHNVEVQRFGEPVVPDYPIPYHVDIMESFDGIDLDAAGRVSGNGFYYLLGDIARLHEAVLAYARDFMIDKGFTYVIPPFMMHGDVVLIPKASLSSDWSLQPDSMKLDSLVIAHQPRRGEYVPGPCTHRPSSHESRGYLKCVTARSALG